jgi:hypothetical protein
MSKQVEHIARIGDVMQADQHPPEQRFVTPTTRSQRRRIDRDTHNPKPQLAPRSVPGILGVER